MIQIVETILGSSDFPLLTVIISSAILCFFLGMFFDFIKVVFIGGTK